MSVHYICSDVGYIKWTKHYCPDCGNGLKTVKVYEVRKNPEKSKYTMVQIGRTHMMTKEVRYGWDEFECPVCHRHLTVDEMKAAEGIVQEPIDEAAQKRNKRRSKILWWILATIFVVASFLLTGKIEIYF